VTERGPIYGVELIETLPLGGGVMLQQMPTRGDLQWVRTHCDRVAAGYEVLLSHWRKAIKERDEALAELQKTLDAGAVWEGAYRESQQESASEIERLTRELADARAKVADYAALERDVKWANDRLGVLESELSNAAAVLQKSLPIGQAKHIGLREVAEGVEQLCAQLATTKEILREMVDDNGDYVHVRPFDVAKQLADRIARILANEQ
jgi:chromosome segregation ATPase